MNTQLITDDFLLESEQAKTLYHSFAGSLPIIDYHCHLAPGDIAGDRRFATLTKIWLEGDHYKWRAMRTCGVEERFITGDGSDWEKFAKWAETVPRTLRNPLYHWTHLELRKPFGITDRLLNPLTARSIWDECNAKLATSEFSTRGILKQMKVEVVCTTDDPADTLEFHAAAGKNGNGSLRMLPTFRPDKAMAVQDPGSFVAYTKRLSASADVDIVTYDDFLDALGRRHRYFHDHGCRLSDHGLETIPAEDYTDAEVRLLFSRLMDGKALEAGGVHKMKSALLYECALMDAGDGWVQQFHLGAMRNNNSRMLEKLGPDAGFDSIGDFPLGRPLAKFLNRLDRQNKLAKTILYNLNPRDNELIATMTGNFQDGSVPGKVQFGSAWWFLDQMDGMTKQIESLSTMGLLSQFIGMITDSRSFLSYPRHDYFRRLLCNILGRDMQKGMIPGDMQLVGGMVSDICYYNAQRYFPFPASAGAVR